VFIYRS